MNYPSNGRIINDTPVFVDVPVNIEKLEDYVNLIMPLDKAIIEAEKEREKWQSSIKTVEEIKKEVEKVLNEGVLTMEGSLVEEIKRNQQRQSNAGFVINIMREVVALKNLFKHFDEISKTDLVRVTENLRTAKVTECQDKIQDLKEKKSKHFRYGESGIFRKEEDYVYQWKITAVYFSEPVDCGGLWLNENNPIHKRLIVLFEKLELDKLPRPKLYRPFVDKENKEHDLHPGYYKE